MKTRAAAAALGLVVAGWNNGGSITTAVSAQAGGVTTGPSVTASGALSGYQPVSDVSQHARMSADVCEMNGLLDARSIDFTAIGVIYRDGRHSIESNGSMRTLGGFARAARSTEPLLGRYERHFGPGWLDAFARDAIEGKGAFAGEADLVRRQGIQKAARDQVLVAWTFHELDAAVDKAANGNFAVDTGAPHNWDEARAYYHGTRPDCSPFATADERGGEFGTGSAVNAGVLAGMRQGLEALQSKNVSAASRARDEVVRNITITYIQSALKYSAAMDAAIGQGNTNDARVFQAEGWAYYRVIEPLVADVNPGAARLVAGVFSLDKRPALGSGQTVARALTEAFDPLRIRLSEVGQYRMP